MTALRYEACPNCGQRKRVGVRNGVMREHVRTTYLGVAAVQVRCKGSLSVLGPAAPPVRS